MKYDVEINQLAFYIEIQRVGGYFVSL